MEFGTKLKEIRSKKKLTQKDIANILSISRTTYNHYEVKEKIIPIKHLVSLSDYFNVSVDYLLNLTNQERYDINREANKTISGNRLKEFRKENKLTQVKLASILNTTFSNIAFYEKGRNLIATSFLYTICKKYKISADYLLGKIDVPKNIK